MGPDLATALGPSPTLNCKLVPVLTESVKSIHGRTLTVEVAAGTVADVVTVDVVVPRLVVTVSVSTIEVRVIVDVANEVVTTVGVEVISNGTVTEMVVVAWAAAVVMVAAAVTPMHEHADRYLTEPEHADAYLGIDRVAAT